MSQKDTYWFSHDSNAKDDPKCVMLIEQLGLEGYGVFWVLVETLRDQPGYVYPLALLPALARRYNTTFEKMKTVVMNYGLFEIEGEGDNTFFSRSLRARMLPMDARREQTRLAGLESARKRALLRAPEASDERAFNERSTSVPTEYNIINNNIINKRNLSIRLTPSERESLLEILFFEKRLIRPDVELERFINHYEAVGWVNARGVKITNLPALLKNWSPDEKAQKFPVDFVSKWKAVYAAAKNGSSAGSTAHIELLTDIYGCSEDEKQLKLKMSPELQANMKAAFSAINSPFAIAYNGIFNKPITSQIVKQC